MSFGRYRTTVAIVWLGVFSAYASIPTAMITNTYTQTQIPTPTATWPPCIPEWAWLERDLPETCEPGVPFTVEFTIRGGTAWVSDLWETVPAGWEVTSNYISRDGDTIHFPGSTRSYTIMPAGSIDPGIHTFSGTCRSSHWCNGEVFTEVSGDTEINYLAGDPPTNTFTPTFTIPIPTRTNTPPPGAYSVSGTVYEQTGCFGFMRGATVRLFGTSYDQTTTTCLTYGCFTFTNVPNGLYTLRVSNPSCNPWGCYPDTAVTVAGADVTGLSICVIPHPTPTPSLSPTPTACVGPPLFVDPVISPWHELTQVVTGTTESYCNVVITGGAELAMTFTMDENFSIQVPLAPGLNELRVTSTRDYMPWCPTAARHDRDGGLLDIYDSEIDTDGDGIPDHLEGGKNAGMLGITNMYLPDTDGDGLWDGVEDANRNGIHNEPGETDPLNRDSDGDGYEDGVEVLLLSSNPLDPGSPDSPYVDSDGDGLPDSIDPNPENPDMDGDRFLDGYEAALLGLSAASNAGMKPSLGDVDENETWDNSDAQKILNFFANVPMGGMNPAFADLDRNETIDNADAQQSLNFFAHLELFLPVK